MAHEHVTEFRYPPRPLDCGCGWGDICDAPRDPQRNGRILALCPAGASVQRDRLVARGFLSPGPVPRLYTLSEACAALGIEDPATLQEQAAQEGWDQTEDPDPEVGPRQGAGNGQPFGP